MKKLSPRVASLVASALITALSGIALEDVTASGASAQPYVLNVCGSITGVTVCGTPLYVTSTLVTDVVNETISIWYEPVVTQHAALPAMIKDINTVAADVASLPSAQRPQFDSSFQTMKVYSDLIKDDIIISGLYNSWIQGVWQAFATGVCTVFPDVCIPIF